MEKWLKVKNSNEVTELYINGDIESDVFNDGFMDILGLNDTNIYPLDIKDALKEAGNKEVHVHINSGGGNLFAGVAISNMIKNHKGKTVAYVDGLAASAASIIAFGCDEIVIPENAYLMIHRASVGAFGNVDDFYKVIDTLETLEKGIINTYMTKVKDGVTEDQVKEMLQAETWLNGKDALNYFNLSTTSPVSVLNCANTNKVYNNIPKELIKAKKDKIDAQQNNLKKELEIELALMEV